MLTFLDAALVQHIASGMFGLFERMPIVYAPPEQARAAIARWYQEKQEPEGENRVAPGICVYRTASQFDDQRASYSLATWGWPQGRTEDGGYVDTQTVPVTAEYTVQCWARNQIEINNMESVLWFLEVYNPVPFDLEVQSFEWIDDNDRSKGRQMVKVPVRVPIVGSNPVYQRQTDEKTGKLLWAGMTKQFQASTYWLDTSWTPQILEIDVDFILSGDPVDIHELRQIVPLEE